MNNNKLAWQTRRFNQDKRHFISLLVIACVLGGVLSLLSPSVVISAESNDLLIRQNVLPVNQSKEKLTIQDRIRLVAKNEGFENTELLLQLAWHESVKVYGQKAELGFNSRGNNPTTSIDRGVFMYNSHWKSNVSNECSFSVECSTKQAIKDIRAGKVNQWVAVKYVDKKLLAKLK